MNVLKDSIEAKFFKLALLSTDNKDFISPGISIKNGMITCFFILNFPQINKNNEMPIMIKIDAFLIRIAIQEKIIRHNRLLLLNLSINMTFLIV